MVQRLAQLGKVYQKDKTEKRVKHVAEVRKRAAKENEKRDAKQKELRKDRYRKNQGKQSRGAPSKE